MKQEISSAFLPTKLPTLPLKARGEFLKRKGRKEAYMNKYESLSSPATTGITII